MYAWTHKKHANLLDGVGRGMGGEEICETSYIIEKLCKMILVVFTFYIFYFLKNIMDNISASDLVNNIMVSWLLLLHH